MLLARVRTVVFDAVGTLIYPDPPAAVVYAEVGARFDCRLSVEEIGRRFRDAFRREEEADCQHQLRTSEERERQRWRDIVGRVLDSASRPDACFEELFEHFSKPGSWRCAPETGEVLAALASRGVTAAMASNYDRRLRPVIAGIPYLQMLHPLIISSEVGWRKPAPAFFAQLIQMIQQPPDRILYVGDDVKNDVEGARAAGLRAVLFDPSRRAPEVDPRIGRLSELVEL
jgi:putative hydrolase of the HAD superfamily